MKISKRKISVSECKEQDIIAENIVNKNGIMMVAENTVVNEKIKRKLIELQVADVIVIRENESWEETARNSDPLLEADFSKFKEKYVKRTRNVKKILDNLAEGYTVTGETINYIVESFYEDIMKNRRIIEYICRMENMDQQTYSHSINVSIYSMMIGKWMGLPGIQIRDLMKAGMLHDIGKLKISKELLEKTSSLSPEDLEEFKKHPVYGYEIAKNIPDLHTHITQAILMHHEREDGSGYPIGLKGDKINTFSKIISMADLYDNMIFEGNNTMNTPFDVIRKIERMGFGYFDIKVSMAFLSNISNCYIGAKVRLSNGDIGEISGIIPTNISNPIVKVGDKSISTADGKISIVEILGKEVSLAQ
ncbi:HD-GYP domain-containing protein [Oxobacter pfennigii]|nr:HD-GYP domain-containing protein [Oxobacter pfennigii]